MNTRGLLIAVAGMVATVMLGRSFLFGDFLKDSDGDGLADLLEKHVYKTDPLVADSDGDLLNDGFEVRGGLDPLVIDDVNADLDNDGLSNLQEAIYDSNPTNADSDGDGTLDGREAEQGSSPTDLSDRGRPPPPESVVKLEVTVGDHSGSHSERYNLNIGTIRHQAPVFGEVASSTYAFARGRAHPVRLVHTGTDPEYLEENQWPDFDWRAGIAASRDGLPEFWLVDDPNQGIFGDKLFSVAVGVPFPALPSRASLIIPRLDIDTDLNADDAVDGHDKELEESGSVLNLSGHRSKGKLSPRKAVVHQFLPEAISTDDLDVFAQQTGPGGVRILYSEHRQDLPALLLDSSLSQSHDLIDAISGQSLDVLLEPERGGAFTLALVLERRGSRVAMDEIQGHVNESTACQKAIQKSDKDVVLTLLTAKDNTVAIGDDLAFQLESPCFYLGLEIDIELSLGEGKGTIRAVLIDEGSGEQVTRVSAVPTTGPFFYQTVPFPLVHNGLSGVGGSAISLSYEDTSLDVAIKGIRRFAVFSLLSQQVEHGKSSPNFIDSYFSLVELAEYLSQFDDPDFYAYALALLQSHRPKATHPMLVRYFLDLLLLDQHGSLDRELKSELDRSMDDMLNISYWDENFLKTKEAKRSLLLLKRAAIAHALNRLSELNRIKTGQGRVSPHTYLSADRESALRHVGSMTDTDDVEAYIASDGLAGNEEIVDRLHEQMIMHSVQKFRKLEAAWARREEARENVLFAERQFEIIFDWEESINRYTKEFEQADQAYKQLLGEHQILATIIEDQNGDEIPAWQAIVNTNASQTKRNYVQLAITTAEGHMRRLLEDIVGMSDLDELVELGGGKYHFLHEQVKAFDAPLAASYVGHAKGLYTRMTDESALMNATADVGVWLVYGAGVFYPPAILAGGAIDVSRSGSDAVYSYADSASAEVSADAGLASVLEADRAGERFKNAMGQVTLDVLFTAGDFKAMSAMKSRRIRGPAGYENKTMTFLNSPAGVEKLAKADAAFFNDLRRMEARAAELRSLADSRQIDINALTDEMDDLSVRQFRREQQVAMDKLAQARRKLADHERILQDRNQDIVKLKAEQANTPVDDFDAQLADLERRVKDRQKWIGDRQADIVRLESEVAKTPDMRLNNKRAELEEQRRKKQQLRDYHLARLESKLAKMLKSRNNRLFAGRDSTYNLQAAREGSHVEKEIFEKQGRMFDAALMVSANEARTANVAASVYQFEDGRMMFGPRLRKIDLPGYANLRPKGFTRDAPPLRYEIRTKGVIRDANGTIIKPPERVTLPNGKTVRLSSTKSMEFDRIVIDHEKRLIYVEDITRSTDPKHLAKTFAYAQNLEKMFPGYNATNIPMKNGIGWPRDIVYSDMQYLNVNLDLDTDKFPGLLGTAQ